MHGLTVLILAAVSVVAWLALLCVTPPQDCLLAISLLGLYEQHDLIVFCWKQLVIKWIMPKPEGTAENSRGRDLPERGRGWGRLDLTA